MIPWQNITPSRQAGYQFFATRGESRQPACVRGLWPARLKPDTPQQETVGRQEHGWPQSCIPFPVVNDVSKLS